MKKGWKKFYTIALKFWDGFNANFANYISQVKNVTPLSQRCGEKQSGSAFKVGSDLSFQY